MSKRLVSGYYKDFYPFHNLSFITDLATVDDPKELTENDVLVIWGGEDISPSLYNKQVSSKTWAGDRPSRRDEIEWNLMQRAKELGIPIIGVCRGAQMLCALAGGFLIQHVERHGGHHMVVTVDGTEVNTNSIHHQMMYPFDVKHEMLASIKVPRSPIHLDVDTDIEVKEEPEFVYFPEVKGFAIQWHPEMMDDSSQATKYVMKCIEERAYA
jgi:putative glutamine amidotransferase